MNEVTIGIDAGVAVVLILAGALADRRRIRRGPVPGGPAVDVVPHTGPPPEVTLQDGQEWGALGLRLAAESGLIRITTEPVPR